MEQSIAAGDAAPEQTIRYTLDLTHQYHNLLQKIMWSRPTSGMVMSREWKKKEGSTFIFRMIWEVRCGLQMKQEEVRKPMDMAFIWQNKYFRIVMWNRCTDYQYYNCCIVFVF